MTQHYKIALLILAIAETTTMAIGDFIVYECKNMVE